MKNLFTQPAEGKGAARRVLNVGGGSKRIAIPPHFDGWEHLLLDVKAADGVDLVRDARELGSLEAGAFDAIYCSHNLEHYYRHDVDRVLQGFRHVLKPGGFAEIRVPDIGGLIKLLAERELDIEQEIYISQAGAITAHDMIYGYGPEIQSSGQDFYAHKTGFSRDSLIRALYSNGLTRIHFAQQLSVFELHVFAFAEEADPALLVALGLGEAEPILAKHHVTAPSSPGEAKPMATQIDEVEGLYQRAVAACGASDWHGAMRLTEQALAREPDLASLHYLLGSCRLELAEHEAALQAYARCLALAARYPLSAEAAAQQALCRARIDIGGGIRAATEPLAANQAEPVSVLICSADPERFARAEAMYRRLLREVPHEIVLISDARSLAEGYNRALRRARHDIVVFTHDDVEIVSPDFAARLLRALGRHELIGLAGTRKMVGAAWHFAGHPHLAGQVGMSNADAGYLVTLYGIGERESKGLQALDGLFLATRRDAALRLGFDEATFDGWHLYDLDFSLRASSAGMDCAACNDILAVHASQGSYDADWLKYAQRFLDKHKGRVEPLPGLVFKPELVSVPLRSVEEWRLLTQHMIEGK
ncbi:MAG TPA: glycosyltransferase [Burkholderiales bacterium]